MMRYKDLIRQASKALRTISEKPSLEAELLCSHVTNKDKKWLIMNCNKKVSKEEADLVNNLVEERKKHTPLAYLTGRKFFYNSNFYVNENTLIPRPETEILVDLLLDTLKEKSTRQKKLNLLEIGTGTGCIPISLIKELLGTHNPPENKYTFVLTEKSKEALKVSRKNIRSFLKPRGHKAIKDGYVFNFGAISNLSVYLLNLDIVKNINKTITHPLIAKSEFDIIFSNPPYIPTEKLDCLQSEVRKEPKLALNGGKKGFDIIKKVFEQTKNNTTQDATYLLEIHSENIEDLKNAIKKYTKFGDYKILTDLSGKDRFLKITLK